MTEIQTSTLRPGLLVSLKTTIRGNVSYKKQDLETGTDESGAHYAKWETERTIIDPIEHESAVKVRGQICSLVRRECSASTFGLLCPEAKLDSLELAVKVARRMARDYNDRAAVTRIGVFVIIGRVADSDVEAVRAINSEVSELISAMAAGVAALDAKAVRDAANRIKSIGQMLNPESAKRAQTAIDLARAAARKIVSAGEKAATEIDQATIDQIAACRAAFIDIDLPEMEIAAPDTVATDVGIGGPELADPDRDPDHAEQEEIEARKEASDPFADLAPAAALEIGG